MANYRWGIDLGTSSIGVAVYETDNNGKIISLKHLDSYIFGEPVAPKEMVTLNTARRSARLIRRQVERKAARLKKMSYIAKSLGVTPEVLRATPEDVVALRAKAVREEISIPQLIKVLSHIVKNRGYKGTLSADDKGTVGKKLSQTAQALTGGKTLGELLYERKTQANGQPWRKVEEDGTFIYRQLVEDEFARIWDTQAKFHPELNGSYAVWGDKMFPDFPGKTEISLKDAFHSAMFYQRPIKWELETVGNCEIYPTEKRAAAAQIAYQHYRMAKTLADLRVRNKNTRESVPLTLAQKSQLFEFLDAHTAEYSPETKAVPFTVLYKVLGLPEGCTFTLDRTYHARGGLKGNTTLYSFEKAGVLNAWSNLTDTAQELVLEFFANVSNLSDIEDNSEAYIKERVPELTKNLKPTPQACEACCQFILLLKARGVLGELVLEQGRSSYSIKALKMLTERIMQGEQEADILAEIEAQKTHPQGKFRSTEAILKEQAINDPVVSRALAEFRRVVAYTLHKFGQPSEVVVELSRDIKNSLRRRDFLEKQNKIQADTRKEAITALQANHTLVSPRNIEKYLLWEEQEHYCPYSGRPISFGQAFDEKQTQVDHIIPQRGEIAGPNVFENKVLAFTDQNKDKSNRLPYEWKFQADIDDYLALQATNKQKKKNKETVNYDFGRHSPLINFVQHLWTLYSKEKKGYYSARDHKYKPTQKGARILRKINNLLATPGEVKQDFVARQNQETAWIGKIVLDWCKDFCPKVTPSYGALTAYLRGQLHFEDVLPLIRLQEGKPLYDKDDKKIDSAKWQELYTKHQLNYKEAGSLQADFEQYCQGKDLATESDKQKAFVDFVREQRTQLQFNKRCDHRHHAVDAAVIGLCDLSLVQRAAIHNKKNGTLYKIEGINPDGTRNKDKDVPGLMLDNIPQYAILRAAVQARLTNYVVWHKPDHFPSSALFDQTAYNILPKDGEKRFVKRAPLVSFLKSNEKKTLENLEKLLFCDAVKNEIITQFKERLAQGMTPEEALCGKKDDPTDGIYYRGNKVKQVKYMYLIGRGIRVFDENADKEIFSTDKVGVQHKKAYQNGGYACMDFDEKTGKRLALIPLWQYPSKKQVPSGVVRVFIGDMLFDRENKKIYKIKQLSAGKGVGFLEASEVKGDLAFTSNLKDYSVVSTRQDIAKLKDNEHTTSD